MIKKRRLPALLPLISSCASGHCVIRSWQNTSAWLDAYVSQHVKAKHAALQSRSLFPVRPEDCYASAHRLKHGVAAVLAARSNCSGICLIRARASDVRLSGAAPTATAVKCMPAWGSSSLRGNV